MRSLLLAAILAVSYPVKPFGFSRVLLNGDLLPPKKPTLVLKGPITCLENESTAAVECSAPNNGFLAQGMLQFTLSQTGTVEISAPWVTADSSVYCMAVGNWPLFITLVDKRPGKSFTILAQAQELLVGNISVGCIGAVPSP